MNRIYLIGYMGAGKTTIGAPLAKKMGLNFIDLDIYIENRYHKTVNELFTEYGERKFREIEEAVLKEVSSIENVVVATGGGTPCYQDNIALMKATGVTVYLKVSIPKLNERLIIGKWKRPKLKNKSNAELLDFITVELQERLPFYDKAEVAFSGEELESVESIGNAVNKLVGILAGEKA